MRRSVTRRLEAGDDPMVVTLVDRQHRIAFHGFGAAAFAPVMVQVVEAVPSTAAAGSTVFNIKPVDPGVAVAAVVVVSASAHYVVSLGVWSDTEVDAKSVRIHTLPP